jgi:hypothetical protein
VIIKAERLYLWMDTMLKTKNVDGDVLEVGCYLGGTAALSRHFLDGIGSTKTYMVVDTFEGFVPDQWAQDEAAGTSADLARHFSSNSVELTRWVLNRHGASEVKISPGDITKMPDESLPSHLSACLLDVDLSEPSYAGLKRLYPRLESGGIILVDDCDQETEYKARVGYERFMSEHRLSTEYRYGMGIVRK